MMWNLRIAARERARDWKVSLAFVAILGAAVAVAGAWMAVAYPALRGLLPFRDAGRLVEIESWKRGARGGLTWASMEGLRGISVDAMAAHVPRTWGLQTEQHGHVDVVLSEQVTGEFFDVLGVAPMAGARLTAREDRPGAQTRVWVSYAVWMRVWGGDRAALGRTVWINAAPFTVAGILPYEFDYPERGQSPDIYIPLKHEDFWGARGAGMPEVIARLRPGVSIASLGQELEARAEENGDLRFGARGLAEFLLGDRLRLLEWLLAAVAILLAVATANASGVWVAKWIEQQRHTAIKLALGASVARVVREQCWQAGVLGAAAAVAGVVGARWLLAVLRVSAVGPELRRFELWNRAGLGVGLMAGLAALAMAASVVSAAAPVLLLSGEGRRVGRRRSRRVRLALAVAQLSLTATLSYAGIVVWHGVEELVRADRGFRTEGVLMMGIGIPEERYNTDEKMIHFHQRAMEELRAIPGVMEAAGGNSMPVSKSRTRFLLDDENAPRDRQRTAWVGVASAGLLRMLEIPLRRGRGFGAEDRWEATPVALVNEAFVRTYMGGATEAVGHRIRMSFWNGFKARPYAEHVIVGVVADTLNRDLAQGTEPEVLLSSDQMAFEGFFYFLRTGLPAASLQKDVERAIWRVDPELERVRLRPLATQLETAWLSRRSVMWLLGFFGATAAGIVAFGLTSSLAATFLEMTRELAIRAAVGAGPVRLMYEATGWASTAVAASWLVSLPVCVAVGRAMSVGFDLWGWLMASGLLGAIGVVAGVWPAMRAGAVDAAVVLRGE